MKNELSVIQTDNISFLILNSRMVIRFIRSEDNRLISALLNEGDWGTITNEDSLYALYAYLYGNSINPYKETIN